MSTIVQKFGGTSMADPARIGKAADRVVAARREGHDVVVVVSAMGSTTDQLLALADQVTADRCDRERDMLVTAGERIATALLCMALQARECESISFTGSQAGILTNDCHQDARIIEVRPVRVEDELARGKVVVVAGYQGVSYKREITTLRRGGSDTTAVALAAALGADAVEIYSDVDGIFSADPRLVPEVARLDDLDSDTMLALAEGGARVLAADAVRHARRMGIALYCRATDPANGTGQTVVRRFPATDPGRPQVSALAGDSDGRAAVICPATRVASVLAALPSAASARAVAIGDRFLVEVAPGAGDAALPGDCEVFDPVGRLTLAGDNLARDPAQPAPLAALLRHNSCELLALTSEEHAIRAWIPASRVTELLPIAHGKFVEI